ncbi:MAG: FkbM family methyltransferase [Acidimicrobiales bacterium]
MAAGGRRMGGLARSLGRRLAGRHLGEPAPAVAGTETVMVHTDLGHLLLAAHDQMLLPFLQAGGSWESEECARLRALLAPGMTFVDVGAHVGYMTLVAAAAVGPTGRGWAVEPSPANAALLRANLRNNGVGHVEVIEAAAWDQAGTVSLSQSPWNTGDNRAYPVHAMAQVEVAAVALDDVLPTDVLVNVVKVDTQGTDHRAVRGMAATLARSRSVLLVEFWPPALVEQGEDPAGVLAGYAAMGFDVRILGDGEDGPAPAPHTVVAAAEAAEVGYVTLLLRPQEN